MTDKPIHVTTAEFQSKVLESEQPVVVDFWAPWCGPCKAIGPVLDDLAQQYSGSVRVAKVNVDEEPSLANTFGVRGIPTLFVIQNGKATSQMVGFSGRGALENLFRDLSKAEASSASVAQA